MNRRTILNGRLRGGGGNGYSHHQPGARLDRESCSALYVAGAPLDYIAEETAAGVGHKHPCRIEVRPGGPGANGGRVFVANGFTCGMICLQGEEWLPICRRKLIELGIQAMMVPRRGEGGAVTLGVPNSTPGALDLYCQRLSPNLRVKELTGQRLRHIRLARLVIVGPMAAPDDEALEVMRRIAANAQYAVLQPHPDLIRHESFGEVGAWFDLVVMNSQEAALRDRLADDVPKLALRLRHDLGEATDLIITNGPDQALAWIEGHWWAFDPPPVSRVVCDAGAGDVLTGSFLTEYRLRGQPVRAALDMAAATAARWISAQPLRPASSSASGAEVVPFGHSSPSWAEIAL